MEKYAIIRIFSIFHNSEKKLQLCATLSTDELPSATKLISLEKVVLKCDSSEIVDKIK